MAHADVVLVLGSRTDLPVATGSDIYQIFEFAGIEWQLAFFSAHRHPEELMKYLRDRWAEGTSVFIAAVGLKPDLPAAIAAYLPAAVVIGVAKTTPELGVADPASSIVAMPPGKPVLVAGYNSVGLTNAALGAWQVLSVGKRARQDQLAEFLKAYKTGPDSDVPIEAAKKGGA